MSLKSMARWLVLLGCLSQAAAMGAEQELRFRPGTSEALFEGAVLRGERDHHVFRAKAQQQLTVRISSAEDNAVFAIYRPGYRKVTNDGIQEIRGQALPGATEDKEVTSWRGVLPESGKYLILVAGTRGNAEYKLQVRID
ncbi:hypothetical protein [Rhodoferax sp.]|uniref:hypothetical protein n=1 Tax=Rhodoferax sp. TaxID=50421 RepID=UPI00260F3ED8|nr:hypothetical protein [Rhodoferax sp.]MDD2923888.1 hypothetical protein [Rhodoferax sp.]